MPHPVFLFICSAVLSVVTLYFKPDHSLGFAWVVPVGLYFIAAFQLSVRPRASWGARLQFTGLALLTWLILYGVSYNVLFWALAPLSGGLGALLITWLGWYFLGLDWRRLWPIVVTGVGAAPLALLFMWAGYKLLDMTFPFSLSAGLIAGLWQLLVGVQMMRLQEKREHTRGSSDAGNSIALPTKSRCDA